MEHEAEEEPHGRTPVVERKAEVTPVVHRSLSRRSSTIRSTAVGEHKSGLGHKFKEWFEEHGGDMSKIEQRDVPVVFIKVKVNAIYEINVAKGTFTACFTVMQDWCVAAVGHERCLMRCSGLILR
jgi:hypothetical protein